jgi:hypothetical protein
LQHSNASPYLKMPPNKIPQPLPRSITYDLVRITLEHAAGKYPTSYYAIHAIIDLFNGWDGNPTYNNPTLHAARKKLQQDSGSSNHEMPTPAQSAAVRKQLERLVIEGVAEKARGMGRSNNSWGYRWITQKMRDQRADKKALGDRGKALARQMSLAFGGDGESGVKIIITPDNTLGIQVTFSEGTAVRYLAGEFDRKKTALLSSQTRSRLRVFGSAAGTIRIAEDFDTPLADYGEESNK